MTRVGVRSEGALSRSRDGKVMLQYQHGGERRVALWEPLSGGAIAETIFDSEGAVLRMSMLKGGTDCAGEIDCHMGRLISQAKLDRVLTGEYSDIRLKKSCPSCGAGPLSRFRGDDGANLPIMPVYVCGSCSGKCYHLTDPYLEYLVTNNRDLFSAQEQTQLDADKAAFLAELKEYIIRIYASKRIMRIK